MAALNVRELGDYIRDQRRTAQISLRQLAKSAGVSNPYLSQIERGLRKPSAEILQQIAKGLRISAEALYVQAGILEEREFASDVPGAILGDPHINERQKRVLLDIYDSFLSENSARTGTEGERSAANAAGEPAATRLTPPTATVPGTRTGGPDHPAGAAASAKGVTAKPAAKRATAKRTTAKKTGAAKRSAATKTTHTSTTPASTTPTSGKRTARKRAT